MCDNKTKNKMNNRLRELMKMKGITRDELAVKYHLSESTVKSYENNSRVLPPELAFKIATDYNVTMDWLYGRVDNKDESDLMVNIILALEQIFVIDWKTITPRYSHRELTLWIDKTFREYLAEIKSLQNMHHPNSPITDEIYSTARSAIQEKYRPYLEKLFDKANCGFDESKFISIEAVEDGNILDYLSV